MPPMRNDPFQRLGLDREVLTVSQLNQRARLLLEDVFPQVWVEGELSNLARPASAMSTSPSRTATRRSAARCSGRTPCAYARPCATGWR